MRQPRDHTRGLPRRRRVNLTTLRLRELERIIGFRFPNGTLPISDAADIYLLQAAKLLRRNLLERKGLPAKSEVMDRLITWAERWAHFAPPEYLEKIVGWAIREPQIEKAETLGASLHLTDTERRYLRITTIAPYDVSKAQRMRRRKQCKRERDRQRAAMRRRQQGMVSRSEYLKSSLSVLRPWETEGITRRTWERRRKRPK